MKRELSITRLYELVEVDTLRGLVFRRGKRHKHVRTPDGRGYLCITLDGRSYKAHRVIWAFVHGRWPSDKVEIDHINRDPADNRLSNLRLASRSQNQGNRRRSRGYYFYPRTSRYIACIGRRGRSRYLGMFDTEQQASAAYQKAHAEQHGEFSPYYVKAAS
jgi:hypothetical protein